MPTWSLPSARAAPLRAVVLDRDNTLHIPIHVPDLACLDDDVLAAARLADDRLRSRHNHSLQGDSSSRLRRGLLDPFVDAIEHPVNQDDLIGFAVVRLPGTVANMREPLRPHAAIRRPASAAPARRGALLHCHRDNGTTGADVLGSARGLTRPSASERCGSPRAGARLATSRCGSTRGESAAGRPATVVPSRQSPARPPA